MVRVGQRGSFLYIPLPSTHRPFFRPLQFFLWTYVLWQTGFLISDPLRLYIYLHTASLTSSGIHWPCSWLYTNDESHLFLGQHFWNLLCSSHEKVFKLSFSERCTTSDFLAMELCLFPIFELVSRPNNEVMKAAIDSCCKLGIRADCGDRKSFSCSERTITPITQQVTSLTSEPEVGITRKNEELHITTRCSGISRTATRASTTRGRWCLKRGAPATIIYREPSRAAAVAASDIIYLDKLYRYIVLTHTHKHAHVHI